MCKVPYIQQMAFDNVLFFTRYCQIAWVQLCCPYHQISGDFLHKNIITSNVESQSLSSIRKGSREKAFHSVKKKSFVLCLEDDSGNI